MVILRAWTRVKAAPHKSAEPAAGIVAATRQLISEGKTPSIDEIASAADVSRRTIYMYFPTLDQLLLDATVGLLSESAVDGALETERYGDDVVARADALARAFVETADERVAVRPQDLEAHGRRAAN